MRLALAIKHLIERRLNIVMQVAETIKFLIESYCYHTAITDMRWRLNDDSALNQLGYFLDNRQLGG